MHNHKLATLVVVGVQLVSLLACLSTTPPAPTSTSLPLSRESKIPASAVKVSPENDENPPVLLASDFENPVPIPGKVNTAGAEDSPFVSEDGNTLYFFFTPDVNVPVEKQILDGVTGLYVSQKVNGIWGEPKRIILQDTGKLAIDGCEFVQGNVMWFCSAREGYTGVHWFVAEFLDGRWQNWRNADFKPEYQVGELYISNDGNQLYFGSERAGGAGKLDIWVSQKIEAEWAEPTNISAVNTADSEGWPALSVDEKELWFYRNYSIWRSIHTNGKWQPAEQIVSPLADEPSLDAAGNLYFVHHFYKNNVMIEADIYVAYKR
jgi:hypothetical protein